MQTKIRLRKWVSPSGEVRIYLNSRDLSEAGLKVWATPYSDGAIRWNSFLEPGGSRTISELYFDSSIKIIHTLIRCNSFSDLLAAAE